MAGNALVVGAGDGISASFARALSREGFKVGLVARRTDKLAALHGEIGGEVFACDAADPEQVARLFEEVDHRLGALDVVHYNASYRTRGPLVDLDPAEVRKTLMVSAFGGFLVAQQAARRMLRQGAGRTMIVSQILTRKAIDKLTSIARGEPQEETVPASAAPAEAAEEISEVTGEPAAEQAVSSVEGSEEGQARTEE